jgi:hypothetical protein
LFDLLFTFDNKKLPTLKLLGRVKENTIEEPVEAAENTGHWEQIMT